MARGLLYVGCHAPPELSGSNRVKADIDNVVEQLTAEHALLPVHSHYKPF